MEQIDTFVKVLLIAAACGYGLSWACLLAGRRRAGFILAAIGWVANAAVFALNWAMCGQPPFGNMYHVLVLIGLCFMPFYLAFSRNERMRGTAACFAFVSALPLVGAMFMDRDMFWRRPPALQSPWFVPHVMAYALSYALAGIAFALTIVRLVGIRLGKARYADTGGVASWTVLRLAFPLMTFGLLSGMLWAERAWGAYWSWDPKETWSLITWTLYVIYFHCRADRDLRRYADAAQVLAFIALLATFVAVNILPRFSGTLHSYA